MKKQLERPEVEIPEKRMLELALKGIEMEYIRLGSEMAEVMKRLRKFEKKEKTEEVVSGQIKKRRRMTAAQKEAISKAQKARWAHKK